MKFLINFMEKIFWLSFLGKSSGEKVENTFLIKLLPNLRNSGTQHSKNVVYAPRGIVIYCEGEKV